MTPDQWARCTDPTDLLRFLPQAFRSLSTATG